MNHQVTELMRAHESGAVVRHHGGKTVRVGRAKYHLKNYLDALKVLTAAGDKQAKYLMLRLTVGAPVSKSAQAIAANQAGKSSMFKRVLDGLKESVAPAR